MESNDDRQRLQAVISEAAATGRPLRLIGGDTKARLVRTTATEILATSAHRGIVNYQPTELTVTARSGTPLRELETALAGYGQMLPFEPPHWGPEATLGGAIASGLSGPRRPFLGAARDFVLGVGLINGQGEALQFGGEVMKNVAGYDVSRLMAGAFGTLGVLTEISLKVLPRPEAELTLAQGMPPELALERFADWMGHPWPLAGAAHLDGRSYVRLAGTRQGIAAAAEAIGGTPLSEAEADTLWSGLRELDLPFFQTGEGALWRLAVPATTPPIPRLEAAGAVIDWGGGQRWIRTNEPAVTVRETVAGFGGHATYYGGGPETDEPIPVFHPLNPALATLHRRLKAAFDPSGILNPGVMDGD